MADVKDQGLVSLDEDDWAVAEGEPDVRGWRVVTADDKKIGEVDDLLADPTAMKVHYITVDLDSELAAGQGENTIRIPISRARLHETDRTVVVDFPAGNLKGFDSAPSQPWKNDEIRMTRSAEELRVGKRQVRAGEVEVKKRVEAEHVREPVKLRFEDVDVQRRPVTESAAHPDVEISADEIRVPIYEEEAVVEKRPVLKEEVIISKRPTEKTETIDADVRKDRIDVDAHADIRSKAERNRSRE
jgi:uncharacterized protein (TIGR02271 family)